MLWRRPEDFTIIIRRVENGREELMNAVLTSEVFPKIKQNAKEAIEYTVHTVNREVVTQYVKPISAKK
jgi:hypothetical protein